MRIGAISIGARPQSTGLDKIDPRRRLPPVRAGQCVTVSTLMGFKVWKFGIWWSIPYWKEWVNINRSVKDSTTPCNFLIFNALCDEWKLKRVDSYPNWLVSQRLVTNMKLTGMSETGYKYGHEKWKCVTSVRPSSLTQMRGIWRCSRALKLPDRKWVILSLF